MSWSKADAEEHFVQVPDALDRPTADVLVKGRGHAEHRLSTAQPLMSWLNDEPLNMASMLVTPEVSHAPMSSLKGVDKTQLSLRRGPQPPSEWQSCHSQNKYDMSVTPPVSHVEMWPYVASSGRRSESPRCNCNSDLPVGHDITIAQDVTAAPRDATKRRRALRAL